MAKNSTVKNSTAENGTAKKRRRVSGGAGGKRRQSREMALQMLYQWDLARAEPGQIFGSFDLGLYASDTASAQLSRQPDEAFAHARRMVAGTLARLEEIDRRIVRHADNWRVERMSAVDRNILRLAIYQFNVEADVPKIVVIDESIELAKKFGGEQSGAFVNGVLDALRLDPGFEDAEGRKG